MGLDISLLGGYWMGAHRLPPDSHGVIAIVCVIRPRANETESVRAHHAKPDEISSNAHRFRRATTPTGRVFILISFSFPFFQ
jgi:hypothetical protein